MIYKYRTEQKRKRTKKIIFLCTFLILILTTLSLLLYTYLKKTLKVTEIIFIGNQHLNRADLKNLMRVSENDPLLSISTKEIYKNIKQSPWVKDVRVRKELSGKIIIQVFETTPTAILFLSKRPYFIDSEGTILEEVIDHSMIFLPIIREIDPLNNPDVYREAITLVNLFKEKKIMISSGQVEIFGNSTDDLTLKIDDLVIKVGSGDYEKKFKRLEKVKDDIMQRYTSIEYIDLRFAEQVIVKQLKK